MKHPQVNASQSSRNAGLVAVGIMVSVFMWHWLGYYAVILSALSGAACYTNDRMQDNDPSKYDPLCTLAGGFLVAALMYIRGAYGY